jgi:aminoglycoside 3-N-acetyltransferase
MSTQGEMTAARTVAVLAEQLRAAGLRRQGICLVHSSLSALGWVAGGADTVIDALRCALGPAGTLLMPALTYRYVTAAQPHFHALHTPTHVGAVAECFRRRADTQRSLHPTHSVCGSGPCAGALLRSHHLDRTPAGPASPFARLALAGGQIAMLGCGLRPNTSMHGVEERAAPPYLFAGYATLEITDQRGRRQCGRYRQHGFAGWQQRYDRIAALLAGDGARQGAALAGDVWVLEAGTLWARAEQALRHDPWYFVEPAAAGAVDPVAGSGPR